MTTHSKRVCVTKQSKITLVTKLTCIRTRVRDSCLGVCDFNFLKQTTTKKGVKENRHFLMRERHKGGKAAISLLSIVLEKKKSTCLCGVVCRNERVALMRLRLPPVAHTYQEGNQVKACIKSTIMSVYGV